MAFFVLSIFELIFLYELMHYTCFSVYLLCAPSLSLSHLFLCSTFIFIKLYVVCALPLCGLFSLEVSTIYSHLCVYPVSVFPSSFCLSLSVCFSILLFPPVRLPTYLLLMYQSIHLSICLSLCPFS